MASQTVLLAETDHRTLDNLPRILFNHLPDIAIDTCTSLEQLPRNVESYSYDTVVLSPKLLHAYRALTTKRMDHLLAPLIVSVGQRDLTIAHAVLEGDAFDLIIKPIVPYDAAHTVRLALWQSKLLRLLSSKEQALSQFRQHMNTFPLDAKAEEEFSRVLDTTCQALETSLQLMEQIKQENALFDMAAIVERRAKQRALDRLLDLCQEGPTQ